MTDMRILLRINRYIVGCKFLTKWSNTKGINELIDTQWDVNNCIPTVHSAVSFELIDTQWDVNGFQKMGQHIRQMELIDTQWDVNSDELLKKKASLEELIDTQWDVNVLVIIRLGNVGI